MLHTFLITVSCSWPLSAEISKSLTGVRRRKLGIFQVLDFSPLPWALDHQFDQEEVLPKVSMMLQQGKTRPVPVNGHFLGPRRWCLSSQGPCRFGWSFYSTQAWFLGKSSWRHGGEESMQGPGSWLQGQPRGERSGLRDSEDDMP